MGVRITWDDDSQKTLIIELISGWTWQDLSNAQTKAHQMIDLVQHDVGVVFRGNFGMTMPPYAVTQGQKLLLHKHAHTRAFIVVGATTITRAVCNVYNRMFWNDPNRQFTFVDTMEQARTKITERLNFVPAEPENLMGVPYN